MPARDAEARFQALDAFLIEHQGLWKPRPFTHRQLPWETQHPDLAQWLRQRSLADAEASHNQPHDLLAPAPFPQLAAQARQLSAVDKLPTQPLPTARHRLNVDVPGRKWDQIEAFGAALHFKQVPTHWLDWCAGKGHLGRRLLEADQALTCLEYDPALIAAGQALSDHHRLAVTHRLQDVMADVAISPEHTPVALHACGDLHMRLLQLASKAGCKQLALAPCCYNRINAQTYLPLSNAGRASRLQLSIDDLGLPLSETVTAGKRVRLQRDTSMARRLGFDQLQRELRGATSNADDLFGDAGLPNVALIGTSFSRNSNFVGFLQKALNAPVGNFSKDGGEFSGAAKAYFESPAFKQTPPKLLIWEIPERDLQTPYDAISIGQ